jgi:hypothetical protein
MPIKNRDGTEYKLQGPNKIMKDQTFWNKDSIVLLNFGEWKETVFKDQQVTTAKVLDEFMNRLSPNEVTFNPEKQEVKPVEKPVEKVVQLPPPPPPVVKPRVEIEEIPVITKNEKVELHKRTYWCQPMFMKKHVDALYGDESYQPTFGRKFQFEAVPMENNTLQFIFWTQTQLEKGSIVFEGGVEHTSDWWQVQKSEEDSGGYIVTTIVSDMNPAFSR